MSTPVPSLRERLQAHHVPMPTDEVWYNTVVAGAKISSFGSDDRVQALAHMMRNAYQITAEAIKQHNASIMDEVLQYMDNSLATYDALSSELGDYTKVNDFK